MEFGVVKWLDEAKGYVCISREHGEDALVSISAVQAGDFKKLKSGETVKFNSEAGGHFGQQIKGWNPKMMLRSIGKKLGVRTTLKSDADLVALVEERIPMAAIAALMENGILEKEIYSVIVPRRTLQHRRARKERLSCEESDRAVRLARLAALAEKAFASQEAGMHWLRTPKKRFRGRTPIDMIATEAGSRLVEEALYQIDEGMAA